MTTPEQDGLFVATVTSTAYGRVTEFNVPGDTRRGPGPRKPTTGPKDAAAPAWWWAEAERVVLDLVANGGTCSTDDLHSRYDGQPSASGGAYGGLFAKLAASGRIVEVGWIRSRRPSARGRRVIEWASPPGGRS